MSNVCFSRSGGGASRRNATLETAHGLALAAAPTFVIMALLTGVLGGSGEMLCPATHISPLSGMGTMYVLMSAFHAGPWLRLIASRRSDACRS
jgi:hypothetical protein